MEEEFGRRAFGYKRLQKHNWQEMRRNLNTVFSCSSLSIILFSLLLLYLCLQLSELQHKSAKVRVQVGNWLAVGVRPVLYTHCVCVCVVMQSCVCWFPAGSWSDVMSNGNTLTGLPVQWSEQPELPAACWVGPDRLTRGLLLFLSVWDENISLNSHFMWKLFLTTNNPQLRMSHRQHKPDWGAENMLVLYITTANKGWLNNLQTCWNQDNRPFGISAVSTH